MQSCVRLDRRQRHWGALHHQVVTLNVDVYSPFAVMSLVNVVLNHLRLVFAQNVLT